MRRNGNTYGLRRNQAGIWLANFSACGIRIQRASTGTKDRKAAEEWCAAKAAEIWRQQKLGEKPALTWAEAAELWRRAKEADGLKDLASAADKTRILAPHFGETPLHTLHSRAVDAALDTLATERRWSATSRNRWRSHIIGVLNLARRKGYAVPDLELDRRKEPAGRTRFLTREEAATLLKELPLHLSRMVRFALATGLRQANVTGLCWTDVDIGRRVAWVWAEDAKGRRNIHVPLNDDAIAALLDAKGCEKHGNARVVFCYHGRPIEQPMNWAWLKAVKRAGLEGFRWHDLRHTWASWHAMGGTPMAVLQQLGGWRDPRMTGRYAHLAPDHVATFAGNSALSAPAQAAL